MQKPKVRNFSVLNYGFEFCVFTFEFNIWAGTQVAKGGRLCNRSVMPKGVMEK
jgi:hypothetical protein